MAHEPSSVDVVRRLDEVLATVRDLVGRREYDSDQRHSEHRFADLERDLEQERQARITAVADEKSLREAGDKGLADRMEKSSAGWRQTFFSGVLPSLLTLFTLAVTVTLALRSGK
ncbi:hypothetical protein [Actinomadura alba]|uniref:DUF3618 domain-containing protein n=1 Tax=Actinomadura alba TaxID=406431 RepID=A0ABR7LI37_9ACTN|nr:hypothetical protein [Actinomadura alba]MBC6464249.1 hypothetical protein [Actinomadura alba]